jgi:hypothetical protein
MLRRPQLLRLLYQFTLVALQLALLVLLAPPLARGLSRGVAFGAFPEGALAIVQASAALIAIGGGAVALAFPLVALLRHRRRGQSRFCGLPRWAVVVAVAGGTMFVLGALLNATVPLLSADARMATRLTARPLLNAGLAVMAAGVLCAELLRRSVGVPRAIAVPARATTERVEVTHPPELATHAP